MKVDLPLFEGPQTRTTGDERSEEMTSVAKAQSSGTTTSGACSGGGVAGAGLLGLALGLGMGHGVRVAGDVGGGKELNFCCFDRRRCFIAAPLGCRGGRGSARRGSSAVVRG